MMGTTAASEWLPDHEGQFVPWWGGLAKWLLQFDKIPKHIAFILDGNRRYAKTHGLDTVIKGHLAGFEKITKVLDWCREIGIKEVTLYAFSIENFKRTKDEVDGLMNLAKEKFTKLYDEKAKLKEKQICFRFFGKKELLPKNLQYKMAQIEEFTKDFKNGYVNVCLAYTSRSEITSAMNDIKNGVENGLIDENDIEDKLLSKCLNTGKSIPIDMLIRTSGEHRLSDFLLYQCSNSFIHFENVLWPEFDYWHLIKAIYSYQKNTEKIDEIEIYFKKDEKELGTKAIKFLEWLDEKRQNERNLLLQEL